jgi:hypothetical protein
VEENRERRWVEEVCMTVVPSGISASQEAETHHEGNDEVRRDSFKGKHAKPLGRFGWFSTGNSPEGANSCKVGSRDGWQCLVALGRFKKVTEKRTTASIDALCPPPPDIKQTDHQVPIYDGSTVHARQVSWRRLLYWITPK